MIVATKPQALAAAKKMKPDPDSIGPDPNGKVPSTATITGEVISLLSSSSEEVSEDEDAEPDVEGLFEVSETEEEPEGETEEPETVAAE